MKRKLTSLKQKSKHYYFRDSETKLLAPHPNRVKDIANQMLQNKIELVYDLDLKVQYSDNTPLRVGPQTGLSDVNTSGSSGSERVVRKAKVFRKPLFIKVPKNLSAVQVSCNLESGGSSLHKMEES